jgi:hypothetical protein
MHATICYDAPGDDARPGSALALRLRALPGFVAYVALAGEEGGGMAAICICEDEESLTAANGLIARWGGTDGVGGAARLAPVRTDAVIMQRGL